MTRPNGDITGGRRPPARRRDQRSDCNGIGFMEEHDKPRSACVDRKLSLLDPELEVSIERPVSDAGRRAEFVAMSNDEDPPVAEQQVATDHRDVALDALARFEDREDGVTDADRQVVTRLSQWRLVQFGVPRCALRQ